MRWLRLWPRPRKCGVLREPCRSSSPQSFCWLGPGSLKIVGHSAFFRLESGNLISVSKSLIPISIWEMPNLILNRMSVSSGRCLCRYKRILSRLTSCLTFPRFPCSPRLWLESLWEFWHFSRRDLNVCASNDSTRSARDSSRLSFRGCEGRLSIFYCIWSSLVLIAGKTENQSSFSAWTNGALMFLACRHAH